MLPTFVSANGSPEMLKYLIDSGADNLCLALRPRIGRSAKGRRTVNEMKSMLLILSHFPDFSVSSDAASLLTHSAGLGDLDMVDLLISKVGVEIDVLDDIGRSALFQAALSNQPDVVSYLLKHGAAVNKRCIVYNWPGRHWLAPCRFQCRVSNY